MLQHGHLGGEQRKFETDDGGTSLTDITPLNINEQDWIPYDIPVSSNDENTLWIARTFASGGVQDALGHEVFKSIDEE